MDTPAIQQFNVELSSIYDTKVPLSKNKIQEITKAAMKGKAHYKHVVFSVEKFLQRCKTEHKIPVLYCVDSIIRTSKKQFKEKDVFGARFLAKFENILKFLLQCSVAEQPRIVRTMNLWSANGVFKEEDLAPFKQICRDHGLTTDVEEVEKLVKGKNADMSIYGGAYIKREKQSKQSKFEARTPPLPGSDANTSLNMTGNGGNNDSFKEEPSDDIPAGCISERQLLELMKAAGCDFGGSFSSDIGLLRKAHGELCKTLIQRQQDNLLAQKSGNIKNLLSSQFDYSDEEDSGDEGKKIPEPVEPKPLSNDEVLLLADGLIRDPNVANALKAMQHERMMKLNQVAMMAQAQQRNMNIPMQPNMNMPPPNVSGMQQGLPQMPPTSLPGMPPTSLSGLPPSSIPGLPHGLQLSNAGIHGLPNGIPGLQLPMPAALQSLPGVSAASNMQAQNAALLGLLQQGSLANINSLLAQAPGGLPFTSPNRPGAPPGAQQQSGMDLLKQQEILKQLGVGPMSVPPPGLPGLLGAAPGQFPPNVLHQLQQQQQQIIQQQMESSAMAMEAEESRQGGRSRDRDRKDSDRKRNKSKERRDNKEKERERRKMGLPTVQFGHAIIATKTLWFGRLPPNCTDTDIKSALLGAGDVIRASVITTKACAYVTMDSRRSANEVISRLASNLNIKGKQVKVNYAMGNGVNVEPYKGMWDADKGITQIPWQMLPPDLESLCVGAQLDVDSLPADKQNLYKPDGTVNVPVSDAALDNSMELSTPTGSPVPPHVPVNSGHFAPVGVPAMGAMGHFGRMPPPIPPQGMPPPMPGMNVPPPGMPGLPPGQPPPFGGRGGFQGGFRGRGGNFRGRGGFNQGVPPPPQGGYGQAENGGGERQPWRGNDRNGGERRPFNEERRPYGGERRDERRFDRDRPVQRHEGGEGDRRWQDRGEGRDRERLPERNGKERRDGERSERRRSRWGDETEPEDRRERRDRDDKDEERRDRRSSRDRESRRERTRSRSKSHDRDRKRSRRESPTYDEPMEKTTVSEHEESQKDDSIIRAPGSDEATVTSTTQDIEMQQLAEIERPPMPEEKIKPVDPVECTETENDAVPNTETEEQEV